jgi:hypothetical protein
MAVVISGSHVNRAILSSISAASAFVCSRLCARPCDLELPTDPNHKLLSLTTNAFRYSSVCAAGSHPIHFVPLVPSSMCAGKFLHDSPPPPQTPYFCKDNSEVGIELNVAH